MFAIGRQLFGPASGRGTFSRRDSVTLAPTPRMCGGIRTLRMTSAGVVPGGSLPPAGPRPAAAYGGRGLFLALFRRWLWLR